jgi:isoleucyl-tRNA synthetase
MYQTLKKFVPKDESVVDDRSIHFLDFPTVREEYFDPEIERSVGRMQAVIELGRTIRERKTISLKVRLTLIASTPTHSH